MAKYFKVEPTIIYKGKTLEEALRDAETIGERINILRYAKGVTEEEAADAVGVYSNTIFSRWEINQSPPTVSNLKALADYFGVEPSLIYKGKPLTDVLRDTVTIGERIRILRYARGLTQYEVADAVGAGRTTIAADWENDANVPSPANIVRLSQCFRVEPTQVYIGKTLQDALKEAYTVGQRIEILRFSRGLNQRELADAIEVTTTDIENWEKNFSTPKLGNLVILANYFGVELTLLSGMSTKQAINSSLNKLKTESNQNVIDLLAQGLNSMGITSIKGIPLIGGIYFVSQHTLKKIADALGVHYTNVAGPDGLTLGNGLISLKEGAGVTIFTHEASHAIFATIYSDKGMRGLINAAVGALDTLGIIENLRRCLNIPREKDAVFILNETLAKLAQLEAKEALGNLTSEQSHLLTNLKMRLQLTDYVSGFGYNSNIPALQALRKKMDKIRDIYVTPRILEAVANGDDVSANIHILVDILINETDRRKRSKAGEELYQLRQSHPDLVNPLISDMMSKAQTIGRRIEILRLIKGLARKDLAGSIKVLPQCISAWETEQRAPTPANLRTLAKHLAVEPTLIYKGKTLIDALKDAATIGERIEILRYSRGLIQQELADAIGFALHNAIIKWENNIRTPPPANLLALAIYFEVEPTLISLGKTLADALRDATTISERIRILRHSRGLEQREIEEAIGVVHTTISDWERNVRALSPANLLLLANYLEIEPTLIYKGKTLIDALRDASLVGERIRILRYSRGLGQSDLARAIGVSRPTITRLEIEGRSTPKPAKILKLANYLGVEPTLIYKGKTLTDALRDASLVGERIKILRYSRGLTQPELADKISVTKRDIENWEDRAVIPPIEKFPELAEHLEVEPTLIYKGKTLTDALKDASIIGERINILRYTRGITQQELADAIWVTAIDIENWENNTTSFTLAALRKLAGYFAVETTLMYKGKPLIDTLRDASTIGERIEILRYSRGLGQKDVAYDIGVEVTAIAEWENDRAIPHPMRFLDLANYFKVKPTLIFEGKTLPDALKDAPTIGERIEILRYSRYLTQQGLAKAIGVKLKTIVDLEDNKASATVTDLKDLATYFGVDPIIIYIGKTLIEALRDAPTVGKRIRILRHVRGLLQRELASAIGVSSDAILRWENEEVVISAPNLLKLADYLEIEPTLIYKGKTLIDAIRDASTMGERIKILRHSRGLLVEKLGDAIGITSSEVSRWENNLMDILPANLLKLAEYFRIEPTLIYRGKTLTAALKDATTIGERIEILRYSRGLTFQKLGDVIGVIWRTISNWEKGHKLAPEYILKLAEYFEIEPTLVYKGKTLTDALNDADNIGERIRILRYSQGFIQQELADTVGVTKSTISNWENNVNTPSLKNLVILANYFGIDLTLLCKMTMSEAINALLDKIDVETDQDTINIMAQALNSVGITSETGIPFRDGIYFTSQSTLKKIANALGVWYTNKDGPDGLTLGNGLILLKERVGVTTFTHEATHAIFATIYSDVETRGLITTAVDALDTLGIIENLRTLLNIPPEKDAVFILNETLATLAQLEAKEALGDLSPEQSHLLTNLKMRLQLTDYVSGFGYNSNIPALQALREKLDEIRDLYVTSGLLDAIAGANFEVMHSEKPILAERIADELIRRRRVFIEYKILRTLGLLIPVFLVGVLLRWLWMKYKDRYLDSRKGNGSNFRRQSGKRKKAKKKKRSQDRPASAAISPATQAKEWIRSVMRLSMDAYKDGRFSIILDRRIDVEGRPLTCVINSKPFDANSSKMFVTAGCTYCAPIICQTKYQGKAFTNHLYHFSIGDENDWKNKRHFGYVDEHLGYIGDRESVVIIPFIEEFEDKYKEVSEYILSKYKNTKVLLIRTKSNTTKAGLVMREGIGINVGEQELRGSNIADTPKKGTSQMLAMTWEQVYALLGSERSVMKDFEELYDYDFIKQGGQVGQLPTEEAVREILKNLPDYVVSLASLLEHIRKEHPEILEIPGIETEDEQFDELVRICCKFNEGDFEDPGAKDIINEATKKRIDFYRAVGQEAREFIAEHEDEFRKLGRKLEMITCEGHSFEVQRRLERRGIKSKIFCRADKKGFHFWVVTEDGFIIDAYTSSAAYTSEKNELLVLKCNQDVRNEYVGKEIGQLKKSIKTRIKKERKIWMGVAERVRAHQIYTDVYNKARNMVLSINPDIEEAGITFACEIIKAIQECMKRLPEDEKIIIHFCTGDTPWIGYIKLAYFLKNWNSKKVQDILRAHGIKGEDLKLKPDMSRVEAYPLDAIFPQKRTAYHSFANILNNMFDIFDRLKIPEDQRHLFYGDVDEDGKNQMSDEDFDRLMKDIEKNGLLIDNPNEIQAPFINAMRKQANRMSEEIEGKEGAHIFLAGVGPSYEGKGHIGFIKSGTSFNQKAFIGSAPRDVTKAHAKENGGLGNFYVNGNSKYGVISFGFYELLLRQGNPDISDDVKVIAIATGNAKNSSVQKLVEGDYDENYPVTGLQDSRGVVVLDQTSAASLRLHTHPWEFYHIDEWNAQLIKKFFIQLSLDTGKPIRELTVQDFLDQPTMGSDEIQKVKEYNLSTLGSWNDLKEQVIQEVKDAIATPEELDIKLGLPAKSRLVFISAHLDDDYFAMRDGIEALTRKGYEVCAYYVTPGYNAVDDRDTANILNHIKKWKQEQLIQYAKLNEEKLTGKLSDLVENQDLHQSPTDYDVWSHMGDEEKLLRAQLLFLSFNQRMNGMLSDKAKCDALINLLVSTLKNKEAWVGKDIKPMCDIKTYIRTTEAKSAMMSLGLKYENIHVPLDPSWYITEERRPTASPEDIEKLKDILRYENRDGNLSMVIYNGEGFPDYVAHSTVEASVDTVLQKLIEEAERVSIFGPMIRGVGGVARKLGKWLPLGLAALLALAPLNLNRFKACQYAGVWERVATYQAQLSLLSTEDKLANFDRKSRQHYPSQSPPILADSGYETPYHFSEQVVINEIRTRGEVATLLGPEDTRKEWQPILESAKAGILNYKIFDFTDRTKRGELKKRLKKKAEELNKVKDAVDSTTNLALNGPAPLSNIAAMEEEIEALKKAGISLSDILSRDEFENQLHNAKQKRHRVAAEKVLRMIEASPASHRFSRPSPGKHKDMQNDARDWNKLTRARAHISFERLFASKLYTKRQVEVLKEILYLYRIDPSRSIRSVFRDRKIKPYVKKQIQEILIDQFIASFYSRKGKNAGKWHVFAMGRLDRAELKKEIDELGKIYKFFAEVLGYEYPCRILQERINNKQLNVLHVPKAQKTIFDAHSSPTYGVNVCSSCRDKGRAIVHELMVLAGSTDDAFNQRVDRAYRRWRDFGKVSDIKRIKKTIRQKEQDAMDKIIKAEFPDITDISIPASLKGKAKLDIEYKKENQFGSVKELEVILGETVEDIAIAYPVGMGSFLRASEQAIIISESEDLRDKHNKLKEYVPMLVATCNSNDTRLRGKAVDYLIFIIARCPAVPLDYVFIQFELQRIEISGDLQNAFRKAYLAEWSSSPSEAARFFDSPIEKEEMEMNLQEIAIFSNRADFCEKNEQPGLADVAYAKAYRLFKWHIKELASFAPDSLEKAELLTLNVYDKTKGEIEQAIEKMFVTISHQPKRFKALGIELDSVERAYANYCLAKEDLKRVQGKIKKLMEKKQSLVIDVPETARRDDIGQTLSIYRQWIKESKSIEKDLEEEIRTLHGEFSRELLLASVEDRDFAKLNDDEERIVRHRTPSSLPMERMVGLKDLSETSPKPPVYVGVVLQATNSKMYVLSVGHDTKVGEKVEGYLGDIRLEGEVIACKYDAKGRDFSLIEMSNIPSDIKFAPLYVGYPPKKRKFTVDIVFADFGVMGRDFSRLSSHTETVSVQAKRIKPTEEEYEEVNILEIYAKGTKLRQKGISGAPVFYEGKDGKLKLVGMVYSVPERNKPYVYAVTGNTILSLLRKTKYGRKFLSSQHRLTGSGSAYKRVIGAIMIILLSVVAGCLFPEISALALKTRACFGSLGNGAELASLGGLMGMLSFGGVGVGVGGRAMGVPVRYRVIGLEEMIESVRDLAKEFYLQICTAKEYLVKVAIFRLPEALALGIARKVGKSVVEIGRRFIAVIVHRPSERERMRWSWAAFRALAQKLSKKEITGIMALVKELNEREKIAQLSARESPYRENTKIDRLLEWTPLVQEMEGKVIEEFVKEVEGNYKRIEVIGEETVSAMEAGEINPEETLFAVSYPGRAYEYVRGKLTEFYRSQGIPIGEIETKVKEHFIRIGKSRKASAKEAKEMESLRRFNSAEGLLVLLALRGVNVKGFLEGVKKGMVMCREKDVNTNPGAQLLILQEVMKKAGRNRVFLVLPEELKEFVKAWRVMISLTGREGKGIIPILEGELASLESYKKNTAFIHVNVGAGLRARPSGSTGRTLASFKKAGYPVFELPMGSREDIGALFYIAEFASVASYLKGISQFRKVSSVETLSPVRQESEEASDSFGAEATGLGIVTGQPLSKHGVKPEVKSMGKNLFVVHVENLLDIKSVREATPSMMKMELEVTPGSMPVLEVMKRIIDAEKEGNLKKVGFVFVSSTRDVRTEVIKRMLTNFMIGAGLSREVVVRAIDSNLIIDEGELRGAGGIIRISGTPKISTRAVLSIINKRVEGRPDAGATAVRIITDKKNNWRNDVTKEMLGKVLWMVPEPAEESKGLSIKDGVAVAIEGSVPEWLRKLINSRYSKEKAKILLDQIQREWTIILRAAPVVDEERLEEFEAQKWIYEIQV